MEGITMNKKLDFKISELDDHELAKLDKILKRQGECHRQAGASKIESLDLSTLASKEIVNLERQIGRAHV